MSPAMRPALAGLGLLLALTATAADHQELESLRSRIEQLRKDIAGSEDSRAEARDQLRESERAISEASRNLRELLRQRDNARNDLSVLGQRQNQIVAEISARQEQLGRLLTARYIGGEASYLKLILLGEDPNQIAREIHYYARISQAQAGFLDQLRAGLARLREIEGVVRDKNKELADIESQQRAKRDLLVAQKSERQRVLERVALRIQEQRRQVRSLERDERRLTRLVEEIAKVIADSGRRGLRNERVPESAGTDSVFSRLRGRLRLPIAGDIANRFGMARSQGGPSWKGLFIRAPSGQAVRSVASGRVVYSEWMRGFGNLLILDHGNGYLTIYGNNESVLKSVGEVVRGGDVVATVGESGGNSESGLYFEMRHEGKPFDPLRWISLK